jgi:hypothetical protein
LNAGAPTNIKDNKGRTPLDLARQLNEKELAGLLEAHS